MSILRQVWSKWRQFGRWLGDQVARVVFTLFYFTIALPFGVLVRLGSDVLDKKGDPAWLAKTNRADSLDAARRLF